MAVGYTRLGLKPRHRPTIAYLAEAKLIGRAHYWLRSGEHGMGERGGPSSCARLMEALPAHLRVILVRGDSGFLGEASVQDVLCDMGELGLKFIFCGRSRRRRRQPPFCRHDEAAWQATEMPGLAVQEGEPGTPGATPDCDPAAGARPSAGGREDVAGTGGIPVSSAGHQPARQCDRT